MNNIEWKDGAVCYANGRQWFTNTDYESDKLELVDNDGTRKYSLYGILNFTKDFQLNEIVTGDFIPASELDNKKKFDDAVDMFGLFGFEFEFSADDTFNAIRPEQCIFSAMNGFLLYGSTKNGEGKRLTYHQIIAIGKLKRMMLERESIERQSSYCRCKQVEFGESKLPKFNVETPMPEVKEPKKHKPVVAQVMVDLMERMEVGIKTYGEALRPNNGRDALQDAYEEALDLACYLKQAMIERDQAND